VHGALVAVMQGNNMWPMFAFGFGGVFVITQMHGLKFPAWLRWSILAAYLGLALFVYSGRDITMIHQITWIPLIDYLAVFLLAGILGLIMLAARKLQKEPIQSSRDG
jgi:CHASE2 domain-containing sensor protein